MILLFGKAILSLIYQNLSCNTFVECTRSYLNHDCRYHMTKPIVETIQKQILVSLHGSK